MRIGILTGVSALLALLAISSAHLSAKGNLDRPNILWVTSEDNTYNYVGAYGDPLAQTPNIDRLASRGIVYENAHSAAPVCAPSRSTIITGVFASSLGTQHMRSGQPLPSDVKFFPEYLRAAGYYCTNNFKTDYNTSTSFARAWDESSERAHWRNRAPGQPFFAVFNFIDSHEHTVFTRAPQITDPATVRVPPYLPDTPEIRADIAEYYDNVSRADAKIGGILQQLEADGLAEDTIVFYYSDNGGVIPRSKRFMFDNGTHVALVAYFPEKYRHMAPGLAGSRNLEMVGFTDLAPTVLALAGLEVPAYMQGRVLAGEKRGQAPATMLVLRDRMDERYDLVRAVTDGRYRYVRNYRPDLADGRKLSYLWRIPTMQAWARLHAEGKLDAIQRRFFEPKPAEQLFDCVADPDNIRDLARDPVQRERVENFRVALRDWLLLVRDTGFMPEPLMTELASGKSPALVARDEAKYPLNELLGMIDRFQLGAPEPEQIKAARRHPLPVFRYWGVVADTSGGDEAGLEPLLRDANPTVRLAAAEALVRREAKLAPQSWNEITAALADGNSAPLRLTAANVVSDLSVRAPAEALAALRRQPSLKDKFFEGYFESLVEHSDAPAR